MTFSPLRSIRLETPSYLVFLRAQNQNRTDDLRITSALLYQLSYLGGTGRKGGRKPPGPDQLVVAAESYRVRTAAPTLVLGPNRVIECPA